MKCRKNNKKSQNGNRTLEWSGIILFQSVCLSESNSCLIVERKRQSHMLYLVTDSLISSRKGISRSDRTNMLTPAGYISSSFKKL